MSGPLNCAIANDFYHLSRFFQLFYLFTFPVSPDDLMNDDIANDLE